MNRLRGQFRGARPRSHPVFPQLQAPTQDIEMEDLEPEIEDMEWQGSYFKTILKRLKE